MPRLTIWDDVGRKGDAGMSCEHLICAQCAGPVAEGRCTVCRAARADIHSHGPTFPVSAAAVIALLILLLALVLQLH